MINYDAKITAIKTAVPAVVVIGVAKIIEAITDGKVNTETAYYISTAIFSAIAGITNFIKNFGRK